MRTILLPAVLLLLAGCGQAGSGDVAPTTASGDAGTGAWTHLPDSPLSPRRSPTGAYVGGEVVFVGGYGGPPCPPNADCATSKDDVLRDGAAYDPDSRTWRRIADAPRRVPELAPTAVLGPDLYVHAGAALLVWHSADDTWDEVPTPRSLGWSGLVTDGTRLVVASGSDEYGVRPDLVLDTATGEWSTLPANPLQPSFDRTVTSTPAGLVLTAKSIDPDGEPADPGLVHAALLPPGARTWSTLPTSDQLGGWRWSWTGRRLVDPTLGGADGGETDNYGRVIPYGGRLEPATGAWSRLPHAPEERTGGWPVEAPGGALVAAEGWVYDDARGSWTRLPRPADGPSEPGTGVWAGDHLVVLGGADWRGLDDPDDWTSRNVWSTGAWAYSTS